MTIFGINVVASDEFGKSDEYSLEIMVSLIDNTLNSKSCCVRCLIGKWSQTSIARPTCQQFNNDPQYESFITTGLIVLPVFFLYNGDL